MNIPARLAFCLVALVFVLTGRGAPVPLENIEANLRVLLAHAEARVQANGSEAATLPCVFPRTFENGRLVTVNREDWCAGFFPGMLWFAYELTGQAEWKTAAAAWTEKLEASRHLARTHDVGFILASSFGNGWRLARTAGYDQVLADGAAALASRFSATHGLIQSWDWWETSPYAFPVIIDNMMNLELLFSGGDAERRVDRAHAATVARRHFRADGSAYHVLDYAADAPAIRAIHAGQGHSVDGAWARGQGWAIYGFTMMYRFTRDAAFLARARRTADWWCAHTRENPVPAWDFAVPNGPRDASAAAVVASALVELDGYAPGNGYRAEAARIVAALSSDAYLAAPGEVGGFLLKHSTGNAPAGHEIDVPLAYADYYYLEALTRLNKQRMEP